MSITPRLHLRSRVQTTYSRANMVDLVESVEVLVNAPSEGRTAARNTSASAPSTGAHAQGNPVLNDNPIEQCSPGGKYILLGWICVASGTPGTWVQMRYPTGN